MQKLMGLVRRCVDDYNMIEAGDRIAVGVSGGKDSLVLLQLLAGLKKYFDKPFDTDVYVGQMVKPFEDWCFDESREVGDTGIVKTDYGFHVMYFVESRPAWIQSTRTDLMADKGQEILEQIRSQYELNVDYSAIELGVVDMKLG